jgi:hypothetical protein
MTNPTTPFSWQMPTASDLVTDLPADFETFGQAVATSMADLLGGTTGQVLSKASNTNMDFTWVTTDDANAIQNSIVDAKGDLIGATANDTPARLAVGSNFAFLQADSSTATGLLWENAGWTSYTPTITAGSGTFTSVTATTCKYKRIGKIVFVIQQINIITNGTAAGSVIATLPFTGVGDRFVGTYRESAVTGVSGQILVATEATYRTSANGYPGGTSYVLNGTFFYEVA